MKKNILYLFVAIIVALATAVLILALKRKKTQPEATETDSNILSEPDSQNGYNFSGFNMHLLLSKDTKNALPEIVFLQKLINAYYQQNVVNVTGQFDAKTEELLYKISSKEAVTLYEFRYYYFVQQRSETEFIEIYRSLTNKG